MLLANMGFPTFVFFVLLTGVTQGFQWSGSLRQNVTLRTCVAENVTLAWDYTTEPEETTRTVEWFHTEGTGVQKPKANVVSGAFFTLPNAKTKMEFLPKAGVRLFNITSRDFGTYTVRVTFVDRNGNIISKQQTAHISLPDSPVLAEGRLTASVVPGTVSVGHQHHIQLACGTLLNHERANVKIVWHTPSGERRPSSSQSNGIFFLALPNPVTGGGYSCHLDETSPGISCLPNRSRSLSGFVSVDEVASRVLVLEAAVSELPSENQEFPEVQDDAVQMNADVMAEVSNLTSDVTNIMLEMSSLGSELDLLGSNVTNIRSEVGSCRSDIDSFRADLDSFRSDFTELRSDVSNLLTQMSSVNSQLDNLTSSSTDLAPRGVALTSRNTNVTLMVEGLTLENNVYQATVEDEITRLLAVLEKRKTVNNNLTERLHKMQDTSRMTKDFLEQPASCVDVMKYDRQDGIHWLNTNGFMVRVFCDQTTDGGGWAVMQRRQDGSEHFMRHWEPYENGFGELQGEFWLGLEKIHRLTTLQKQTLRVDLEDFSGNTAYAKYSTFRVAGPSDKYRLTVGGYGGNAGDSLAPHNNQAFSTHDRDNDAYSSGNCAVMRHGAWWYHACLDSSLNGRYKTSAVVGNDGVVWFAWKSNYISLKKTEMKIRPAV